MMIAGILIIIGAVFLLKNTGLISGDFWSIFWPCLLILLGLAILEKSRRIRRRWSWFSDRFFSWQKHDHRDV